MEKRGFETVCTQERVDTMKALVCMATRTTSWDTVVRADDSELDYFGRRGAYFPVGNSRPGRSQRGRSTRGREKEAGVEGSRL